MDFRKLSTLDKFLLIYGKSLDKMIEDTIVETQRNVYIEQRKLVDTIANFVKHIDNLTDDELLMQLKDFKNNEILSNFISELTLIEGSEDNA